MLLLQYENTLNKQLVASHDCSTLAVVHKPAPAHERVGSRHLCFVAEASRPQILRAGIAAKALARPACSLAGSQPPLGPLKRLQIPKVNAPQGPSARMKAKVQVMCLSA